MPDVAVIGITKRFGSEVAVDDVTIRFEDGALFGLLGPSGSGKTTLLRLIAGFEHPDAGHVEIAGEPVEDVPVERRQIGMVFQNYALFPNMNVFDNIAFGLAVTGVPDQEVSERVREVLDIVQLERLDQRRPHQLSGGQKQRVALARALVTRPKVLLLDEPLSALDKALRVEMQVELKRIQSEVNVTTIFVTHDQEEALTLSDQIGILDHGRLVQAGAPEGVYDRPTTAFVARFLGDANILAGEAEAEGARLADGTLVRWRAGAPKSGPVQVCIRPELVAIHAAADAAPPGDSANRIPVQVVRRVFSGDRVAYHCDWRGQIVKAVVPHDGGVRLAVGDAAVLTWPPASTVALGPAAGEPPAM